MEQFKKLDARYWMLAPGPLARSPRLRASAVDDLCGLPLLAPEFWLLAPKKHFLENEATVCPSLLGFMKEHLQIGPKTTPLESPKGQKEPTQMYREPTPITLFPTTLKRFNPSSLQR